MSALMYHLAAGEPHEKAAIRLHAALVALGHADLDIADVYDLVIENFNSEDFTFGRRLLEASDDFPWQSVYLSPGIDSLSRRHDLRNVSESREEALGFLLEEIDNLRLQATALTVDPQRIEIHGVDGFIARIEPIRFETPDPIVVSRVERSLKGLQLYGQGEMITHKLRAIPGLGCLRLSKDHSRKIHGTAFIKSPASYATMLRRLLEQELGVQVRQNQAQELIAVFFGASNWQQIIHCSERVRCLCGPSAVVEHDGDDQKVKSIRYFQIPAMALWELGRMVKHWNGPALDGEYSHLSNGVPYVPLRIAMAADVSAMRRLDASIVFSVYGPPIVAAGSQLYFDAASALLQAPDPAAAFAAYLGSDRIGTANQRIGITQEKVMRFAGQLFTIREIGGSSEAYLYLERFTETQQRISEHAVRISSASIGIDPATGGYSIYHDRPEIPLDALTDEQRKTVLKWAGIFLRHESLMIASYKGGHSVH